MIISRMRVHFIPSIDIKFTITTTCLPELFEATVWGIHVFLY
jgi:hypothetical protein